MPQNVCGYLVAAWYCLHVNFKVNGVEKPRMMTHWRGPSPIKGLWIYQYICPSAFKWLQKFNELKKKLFIQYEAAVDKTYYKNHL